MAALRPVNEFVSGKSSRMIWRWEADERFSELQFDHQRLSRPADMNECTSVCGSSSLLCMSCFPCNVEDERQRWDTQTSGKENVPRWNGMPVADAVKQFSGQCARRCGGTSSAIIVVKLRCGPMKMESLHDFMPRIDFFLLVSGSPTTLDTLVETTEL